METNVEILAIWGAQRGDQKAWRDLFDWHFEAVYGYCLNLGSGRQEMAEEIAQQAFMTAAAGIGKFDPRRGTFRVWLLGIARNRFMKLQAKERRGRVHETLSLKERSEGTPDYSDKLFVHEALGQLPVHYRLVLEAKYLRGLTVNQIAEARNSTSKAAESLLTRAREKFAQVYERIRE